jgi:hypothetical protein
MMQIANLKTGELNMIYLRYLSTSNYI